MPSTFKSSTTAASTARREDVTVLFVKYAKPAIPGGVFQKRQKKPKDACDDIDAKAPWTEWSPFVAGVILFPEKCQLR